MAAASTPTAWPAERVLALAPDAASVRAARALAHPARWIDRGGNATLVWGRYQGSGKDPYQVTVDLTGPGFTCTCPSSKYPCKHALGLLLLGSNGDDPGPAERGDPSATREAAPATAAARVPVDAEAQAQRQARRIATMDAGIDDFDRWLHDLVRQGLGGARRQPFSFWDGTAARLVDAQLPGLADRVRSAGGWIHSREDWAERLLAQVGRWYLVVQGWRRRDSLVPDLEADLRVVLGWGRRTDEVLAGPRQRDRWQVVGRRIGDDGRLQSQRTWLVGETTGTMVLLLDFAAAGQALPVAQVVGTVVDGELALYPGTPPRRAILVPGYDVPAVEPGLVELANPRTIEANLDTMATLLAANPWAARGPMALAAVVAVAGQAGGRAGGPARRAAAAAGAAVVDRGGRELPLAADADPCPLLPLPGGRPADLFAEWDGDGLFPVTVA